MAKKLVSLHGGGGNGGPGGYGSGASHPATSGVQTIALNGPGGSWSIPVSTIIGMIAPNVQQGDDLIICGFSAGGGAALQILQSGETFNGTLRGVIADDPAWPGTSSFANKPPNVHASFYACQYSPGVWAIENLQGGPPPGGVQAMCDNLGITPSGTAVGRGPVVNPYYNYHHPMMPNIACYDEALSGSTWWTGTSEPPPDPDPDTWPLYDSTNGTLISAQSNGIQKVYVTSDGANGAGYVGRWYQSPEVLRFSVDPTSGGSYDMFVRYRQANSGGSVRKLRVGGVDLGNHTFNQNTPNWSDSVWSELRIPSITLSASAQNVDLEYVSSGGPDVDQIRFVTHDPGGGSDPAGFGVKTARPGFFSTGYIGGWDTVGQGITWSGISVSPAGSRKLRFRYSQKNTAAATRSLYLDSVKIADLSFPKNSTGDTDNVWSDLTYEAIGLTAGNHTVKLQIDSGQSGLLDLDRLTVLIPGTATTTRVLGVIGLPGAGGGPGSFNFGSGCDFDRQSGVTTREVQGNSGTTWAYGDENSWLSGKAILDNAAIGLDQIILHGFSAGAGFAIEVLKRGYTFGGRLRGVIVDDPAYNGSPTNPAGIPVKLYAVRTQNTGNAINDWFVNAFYGITWLEQIESGMGIARTMNPYRTSHSPMTRHVDGSGPLAAPEVANGTWWT